MATPFKDQVSPATVASLAARLSATNADFDGPRFAALATRGLGELELKARISHIADALAATLGDDIPRAIDHIIASLPPPRPDASTIIDGVDGFEMWPLAHYVETRATAHFEPAMRALEQLTNRFTAEFAVRPLLAAHPTQGWARLTEWATHPDVHVRRLVSEGTRPRLPWASRIPGLCDDPSRNIPLLHALVDDPELYVRRSVANHLGDIAKDHPDLAVEIATQWWQTPSRHWVVRHGLRHLIKQGHPGTLALLGYGPVELTRADLHLSDDEVRVGDTLTLTLTLTLTHAATLLIDYVLIAPGANGPRRWVYKWTTRTAKANTAMTVQKRHPIRQTSTRPLRAGPHRIIAQLNGRTIAEANYDVVE